MTQTNKKYRETHGIKDRHVSVFLQDQDRSTKFFCPYCRNPICMHTRRVIAILPGMQPFAMPMSIKCSNKNCGAIYHFFSI
jgi:hypothetical protein